MSRKVWLVGLLAALLVFPGIGLAAGDLDQFPEPASLLLLGAGLIGFAELGRKKFKDNNSR